MEAGYESIDAGHGSWALTQELGSGRRIMKSSSSFYIENLCSDLEASVEIISRACMKTSPGSKNGDGLCVYALVHILS